MLAAGVGAAAATGLAWRLLAEAAAVGLLIGAGAAAVAGLAWRLLAEAAVVGLLIGTGAAAAAAGRLTAATDAGSGSLFPFAAVVAGATATVAFNAVAGALFRKTEFAFDAILLSI